MRVDCSERAHARWVTSCWFTTAEGGSIQLFNDGSLFLTLRKTEESLDFYHLTGPGRMQRLGGSPRPLALVSAQGNVRHRERWRTCRAMSNAMCAVSLRENSHYVSR